MAADESIVKKIADLAAISIKENEINDFSKDLNSIIGYMEQLSRIDTGDLSPMEHVLPVTNVFRDDEVTNICRRDELLRSASVTKDGCYFVPNVVDL
ncbi:MAG: Asp-tRNA(Asn)/Glu-tRNA(Gln) amidotransferase subunit GatC [Clostridiaceae bacterium]|nr:Asp-tRNA(Asn)/Glu-tRNA(Gln) amidotransferase subunit GatC [Clostridiaceae bacterium]